MNPYWKYQVPLYVTEYHGQEHAYSVAGWIGFVMFVLVIANLVGWGIYGVIELIAKVVGLF